jgi:DNA-binding winged helix-turn-helix (wHTH) protein
MEQNITYAFGQFRLQTESQVLWHEDATVRLQPKVYFLLLYFVQHTGRLIPRRELFDTVWQGRVVEDSALRLAVNSLRKALRDEIKAPRYILTTCKSGYRFLPEVHVETTTQNKIAFDQVFDLQNITKAEYSVSGQSHQVELDALIKAFVQATDGKRNLIFLDGDRGSGKTALLERFLANIGASGFSVLRARCVQLTGAVEPFLPLLEALERRCQSSYGKAVIDCMSQFAPTWLYQILNMLGLEILDTLKPKVSNVTTGRMLREGADFFEMLAKQSTFILILDNCQWCDVFTLDLINFLAFRSSGAKLLLIVSYRSSERNASTQRIEQIREELHERGLCQKLSLNNAKLIDNPHVRLKIGNTIRF